jgi:hypothetical protein
MKMIEMMIETGPWGGGEQKRLRFARYGCALASPEA